MESKGEREREIKGEGEGGRDGGRIGGGKNGGREREGPGREGEILQYRDWHSWKHLACREGEGERSCQG